MLDDPTISASSALLIGVSSWSDRSLTQDSKWYPRKTMKAAERMSFYADHFPLVEMETAYRFPPTVAATEQWVERTPDGFKFDIPAWSLLTGQPTYPPSLYEDLAQEVRTDRRDRVRLYSSHLSSAALDECWSRFVHSLTPLLTADKLGTVSAEISALDEAGRHKSTISRTTSPPLGRTPGGDRNAKPGMVRQRRMRNNFQPSRRS